MKEAKVDTWINRAKGVTKDYLWFGLDTEFCVYLSNFVKYLSGGETGVQDILSKAYSTESLVLEMNKSAQRYIKASSVNGIHEYKRIHKDKKQKDNMLVVIPIMDSLFEEELLELDIDVEENKNCNSNVQVISIKPIEEVKKLEDNEIKLCEVHESEVKEHKIYKYESEEHGTEEHKTEEQEMEKYEIKNRKVSNHELKEYETRKHDIKEVEKIGEPSISPEKNERLDKDNYVNVREENDTPDKQIEDLISISDLSIDKSNWSETKAVNKSYTSITAPDTIRHTTPPKTKPFNFIRVLHFILTEVLLRQKLRSFMYLKAAVLSKEYRRRAKSTVRKGRLLVNHFERKDAPYFNSIEQKRFVRKRIVPVQMISKLESNF